MTSHFSRLTGLLLALALILLALTGGIRVLATVPVVMERMMLRYAPPEATGLNAADYPETIRLLTDYLGEWPGEHTDLPLAEAAARFHDYEWAHLKDCAALLRLDTSLLLVSAALLLMLLPLAFRLRRPAEVRKGLRLGLALASLVTAGLLLWGLLDFDGLFIRFHQVFFRNSLWLLNPQTDLLVRLMPLPYFIHCALILTALLLLALAVLLTACRRLKKQPT